MAQNPLICPPQSNPFIDTLKWLFNTTWYLFFNALGTAIAALRSDVDILASPVARTPKIPTLSADLAVDYDSTITYADIGVSVTLTQPGLYEIEANIDWSVDVTASQAQMQLMVGGVAQAGTAGLFIGAASVRASCAYTWRYVNSGTNVAKLQNRKIAPFGAGKVFAGNTGLRVKFLG